MIRFLLILGLITITSCKSQKIVDRSVKPRPDWVFGIEKDFIIVEGRGNTHDEAKMVAYTNLKERIVESIAVNVSTNSSTKIDEDLINNIGHYRETFSSDTKISSNFLSALRGVSLNRAEAFYWEVLKMPDKSRKVCYHIKYPFSFQEQNQLLQEWERLDVQMSAELKDLEQQFENMRELTQVVLIKNKSGMLKEVFSEPRKTQAALLEYKANTILNNLYLEVKTHNPGQLVVQIKSNGSVLKSTKPLQFESDCAQLIEQYFSDSEQAILLQYEIDFCNKKDNETIKLIFEESEIRLEEMVAVPENDLLARLRLNGDIRFLQSNTGGISQNYWQIPLRSHTDVSYEILKIELTLERHTQRLLSVLVKQPISYYIEQEINEVHEGRKDFTLIVDAKKNRSELEGILQSLVNLNVEYMASGRIIYKTIGAKSESFHVFENVVVR